MLSAESRKYFRNAIPMGGSAFAPWAMNIENDNFDYAIELAKTLTNSSQNIDRLIEAVVAAPTEDIVKFTEFDYTSRRTVYFKPTVERKFPTE